MSRMPDPGCVSFPRFTSKTNAYSVNRRSCTLQRSNIRPLQSWALLQRCSSHGLPHPRPPLVSLACICVRCWSPPRGIPQHRIRLGTPILGQLLLLASSVVLRCQIVRRACGRAFSFARLSQDCLRELVEVTNKDDAQPSKRFVMARPALARAMIFDNLAKNSRGTIDISSMMR